jgi:hypothetical protein
MTKGIDMFGVDWSQISRDWSRLSTTQQKKAQKRIDNMFTLKEPFHVVVHNIVESELKISSNHKGQK